MANNIIVKISDTEFTINAKRFYQDMDGKWIAAKGMTTEEVSAAQRHLLKINKLILSKN